MSKMTHITATASVPAESSVRGLEIVTGTQIISAIAPSDPLTKTPKPTPVLQRIRYAAAVLEGPDQILEFVAECFVGHDARVRKHESDWILESSTFEVCTSGEQIFPMADDIVSRLHRVMALYCGTTQVMSVSYIFWINAAGEKMRSIRAVLPINVTSSAGMAELKSMRGMQPLGTGVLQTSLHDEMIREALTLHGESKLSWSQIYDIIELFGGVDGIAKAGRAGKRHTRIIRQTANHYRHLGGPKKNPLPSNPPTLTEATDFVRSLLKQYISSRL